MQHQNNFNGFNYYFSPSLFLVVIISYSLCLLFYDLFCIHHTHIHKQNKYAQMHTNTYSCSTPWLLSCRNPTLWREKKKSECWHLPHAFGLPTSRWVQCFGDTLFSPPRPNQVTVNFPAVSEQASDEARPNRTDGWALFAFCCYLFMCLFFLSLSPLIQRPLHPFLPLPQVPTRKHCLVTSGEISMHTPTPVCSCVSLTVSDREELCYFC